MRCFVKIVCILIAVAVAVAVILVILLSFFYSTFKNFRLVLIRPYYMAFLKDELVTFISYLQFTMLRSSLLVTTKELYK